LPREPVVERFEENEDIRVAPRGLPQRTPLTNLVSHARAQPELGGLEIQRSSRPPGGLFVREFVGIRGQRLTLELTDPGSVS